MNKHLRVAYISRRRWGSLIWLGVDQLLHDNVGQRLLTLQSGHLFRNRDHEVERRIIHSSAARNVGPGCSCQSTTEFCTVTASITDERSLIFTTLVNGYSHHRVEVATPRQRWSMTTYATELKLVQKTEFTKWSVESNTHSCSNVDPGVRG